MVTKKDRRHNGYVAPDATVSKKALEKNYLVIDEFYDNWHDQRDGQRDWFGDNKKIKRIPFLRKPRWQKWEEKRERMNLKQGMLLKRRQVRQFMKQQRR